MIVFAAASAWAFFNDPERWFDGKGGPQPLEIDGKPNYNMGPVKVRHVAAMFWGIAGFLSAWSSRCSSPSRAELRSALDEFWPDAPAAHLGGHFRLRRQRAARHLLLRGAEDLPGAPGGDLSPWFVILGYNLFIVVAGTGYLLGVTQGKEYAEPEWYADLFLTVVWVTYLLTFLATVWRRQEPHIYVANWFFLGFIVTIAVLHLGNNATIPVSILSPKSYIVWSGVQDAMFQWWYGHNAVGFFLTAGFLAIMYYFIPKRAERPVYSYRLSIIHFWALIFIYIWAGPHHLHYTALPDWAQTLGMTFSIMLWMPSWGGMINA